MNSRLISLVRKELIDAIRDKRSVMAGLYYALLTPIILAVVFSAVISKATSPEDITIKITNASEASHLIKHLRAKGIQHSDDSTLRKPITLVIGQDYAAQLNRSEPADITLIADYSEDNLKSSIRRTENALRSYSSKIASLRLITRGIKPSVINPLEINLQDQATSDSKGGQLLGMMVLMIVLSVFVSGMNLAIDTSAGERERNSLALLLSHPISIRQLVVSKIIAVSVFGLLGLLLVMLVSRFVYPLVPWEELGFSVEITYGFMLIAMIIGTFVAVFAASMQLFVSFMANSFKEAQTYLTFVMFVPMVMSYATTLDFAVEELRWAPVSGQLQALIDIMKGKDIPLLQLTVSCLSTLGVSLALTLGMERMLKSEKIVFGL